MQQLTVDLCKHYYLALSTYMQDLGAPTYHRRIAARTTTFDSIEKGERIHFKRAAKTCAVLNADPREFITAQFHAFTSLSAAMNKALLPQPQHLYSLGAQVRYIQYRTNRNEKKARAAQRGIKQVAGHYREDRKLNGLARMMRLAPADVLAAKPEEFSEEYLRHHGVWEIVRKRRAAILAGD